jgi:hypothetical protein
VPEPSPFFRLDRSAEAIECAYDPSRRSIATDRLLWEAVHEYGGPQVHNGSQDQQRFFDSTCCKLHRFPTLPRPWVCQLPTNSLDEAERIAAHIRGDWAAANAQFRTFIESLFDEIARHSGCPAAKATNGLRRTWLAKEVRRFLS